MTKVPKITSLQYLSNISSKTWRMKLSFCLQSNIEGFFKFILSFYVRVARCAYITHNRKVNFFCNILRKKVNNEIDLFHVEKYEDSLQINTDIWWWWSNTPRVSKISSLQYVYNISKNKLQMKSFFCMHINIKVTYKFNSKLWLSKFLTSWYWFYWWAWSSILKILKLTSFAISLQYLKKGRSLLFASK